MSEKTVMQNYIVKDKLIRCVDKISPGYLKKSPFYGKRNILDGEVCQSFLTQKILSGVPFMAGRFGSVELRCMIEREKIEHGILDDYSEKTYRSMHNNAGFFPAKADYFEQFSKLMYESTSQVDLVGVWFNHLENYYLDTYAREAQLTLLKSLEPYYFENPWSSALKDKKVLVVHPFAESIQLQYQKREKLFSNVEILPEFELFCYKAPQTVCGEDVSQYKSWFEVLQMLHDDIKKIDFDLAILGCGAYGFPLAAKIKMDGKQAIHMGGATQILFGIKGKRWDDHPVISKLYNEHWIRPGQQEQTVNFSQVENGCYW